MIEDKISHPLKHILLSILLCAVITAAIFLGGCQMKSVTEINKDIYPDDFDLTLAQQKGIGSEKDYVKVQDNYAMLLGSWLNSLYDFQAADAKLDAEGFLPPEEERQDYYYTRAIPGSKYFYLRNNIHVERLSQEQIDYLKSDITDPADPQGLQIVKDTCEDVLAVRLDFMSDVENYMTSYHNSSRGDQFVPNTALVFYVDYRHSQAHGQEYWDSNNRSKALTDEVSQEIITALQPSFDVDIIIFNQVW